MEALARIGDVPGPTWISRLPEGEAGERETALRRRHGVEEGRRLPLLGVPFAVKDNIDVEGLPTTAGCPDFAYRPAHSATVVTRLLRAGAMAVGKTNLDQFATGLTGMRSPYGADESVFGGDLVCGGSSSGSALAVARGDVPFALGTDTAGSGRVPAALNGIVGVKPTRGLLSTRGVVPACRSLDCVSIFSRTVAEAQAVLAVAAGLDPLDPWSRDAPLLPRLTNVRLGLPSTGKLEFFGDELMRQAHLRDRAAAEGAVDECVPVDLTPFLEAGQLLYDGPWVAERLAAVGPFLEAHPASVLPVTRSILEQARSLDAVSVFRAEHRLREIASAVNRLWERFDVLLLPTIPTTFTREQVRRDPVGPNVRLGYYTHFANLLDLAAITIPTGVTGDGRPSSVMLVGPAFSDARLLRLAAALLGEPAAAGDAASPVGATAQSRTAASPPRRVPSNEPTKGAAVTAPTMPASVGTPGPSPAMAAAAVPAGQFAEGASAAVALVAARRRRDHAAATIGPVAATPYAWPYDGSVPVSQVALVLIDWQVDFCGPGGYVDRMGYDIALTRAGLPATARLLDEARSLGMLVVHTREGHLPDLSDLPDNKRFRSALIGAEIGSSGPAGRILVRGEPGWQIVPEVAPLDGEVVIDKPGKGAFYATSLDLILRSRGITHLILTGITTDVCVSTTMREANDRGLECVVLSDCTGATDPGNHAAALRMVTMQGGVFGCVSTSGDILAAVTGAPAAAG